MPEKIKKIKTVILTFAVLGMFLATAKLNMAGAKYDCTLWGNCITTIVKRTGKVTNKCECLAGGWTEGIEVTCRAGQYICNNGCCKTGQPEEPPPPPACEPEGLTQCGPCSASCGGGTMRCHNGCRWVDTACNTQSCCTPSCPTNCGQSNGCGGTCSNADSGSPGAVNLNPSGGSVSINPGQQVTVSWSAASKAESYQIELYPSVSNCGGSGDYCAETGSQSYSFTPLSGTYYYRVRGLNTTCGTDYGPWEEASFTINGTITGQVKLDDSWNAGLVGGVCRLDGAPGQKPGGGSLVTAIGPSSDSGVVEGDGSYGVSVLAGTGQYTVGLKIGDPSRWVCTCPRGCIYGGISTPKADLDFYVSEQRLPWFQVDSGNIHADGGNVSTYIPDTCTGDCELCCIM